MTNISILGAGTWGTALARMLANSGNNVTVWSAIPEEVDRLAETRKHPNLPGMVIPDTVAFTKDIEEACRSELVLFAVPSVFVRSTAKSAAPFIKDQIIIDVAKGIEPGTLMMMSEIIRQETKSEKVVALSGPTHAEEVAVDQPTTIVSACADDETARFVQNVFSNTCMRVYTNRDIRGVELCGALKNIIALASGICAGLGYGDNAKAALMTRGLAEISRLGRAMGCVPETFMGLAGMGDLIVTATSVHSRNNRCGTLIGQGIPVADAVKQVGMVVEGINAVPAAMQLKEIYGIEMPLVDAVKQVLDGADPREIVRGLMLREKKSEEQQLVTERALYTGSNDEVGATAEAYAVRTAIMEKAAIAGRMLLDGKLSYAEIARYTGLSEQDIRAIEGFEKK